MERHVNLHPRINRRPLVALIAVLLYGPFTHAAGTTTITQITYDAGDQVATVTDPRGLVTTYAHDGLGQLWQRTSPDTGTTSYGYDSYGRRSSMTRADGVQTSYGYDGINRLTTISAGGQTQSFTYDTCTNGVGRLCGDSDATGATSYSYTPEGWMAGRGFSMGGTTYAIGYSRDAMGHLTTVNYPDGNQANYTFTDGVVSGVSLTVGGTVLNGATAITYRPADSAMATWTSSNGLSNTMGYDDDGRLTAIFVPGVQNLGFTYDSANRITQVANGIDSGLTQNFGYDDQSRLVSVYSGLDNESFQYDANGNRITQTTNGASWTTTVSATSNQLVSRTGATATQFGYDAQGNTTTVSSTPTYSYDAFNRLNSAGGMSYYVNPEGQRLRKTGTAGTTYFAPDQGGALLAEDPGSGWIDYVWLNGRLIGRVAGGQVDAIHDDQVGRPEAMTNASQAVVWRAQNFPFTQNVTVASVTLNLGFPGQYYDAETGDWNNGFRDYSSALGRYIESDPIGLMGGMNTYAYVGDNPISNADLLGLCPKCTEAQKEAARLAQYFDRASKLSGLISLGSGLGAVLAGVGEGPSAGFDTPITLSLASTTSFFGTASFITGAAGSSLSSFASGDLTALGNFNFSQLYEIAAKAAASRIPGASGFADTVGNLAGQAVDLAAKAPEACQSQ